MKKEIEDFWSLYDQYIVTGEPHVRPELSALLKQIENTDRKTQLLRPEKGWDKILAWQLLRTQEFIFSDTIPFVLYEGEILAWTPRWDRDVFLTRLPSLEFVSGRILKPGFKMTHEDRGDMSDWNWNQSIRAVGLTNERGLYLPLYDPTTLMKFCDQEIAKIRPRIIEYLKEEKDLDPDVLKKL